MRALIEASPEPVTLDPDRAADEHRPADPDLSPAPRAGQPDLPDGRSRRRGQRDRLGGVQHLGRSGRRGDRLRGGPAVDDDRPRRHPPGPRLGGRRGPDGRARDPHRTGVRRPARVLRPLPPRALRLGRLADPRRRRGRPRRAPGLVQTRDLPGGHRDDQRAHPGPDGRRSRRPDRSDRRTPRSAWGSIAAGSSTCSSRRSPRSPRRSGPAPSGRLAVDHDGRSGSSRRPGPGGPCRRGPGSARDQRRPARGPAPAGSRPSPRHRSGSRA